MKADDLTHSNW